MLRSCFACAVPALFSASLVAQIPAPNPQLRVSPRAEWSVTTGVTGTAPLNRHWSQSANNLTSLFVFGGRTGTSGSGSKRNDLHEFDATTLSWMTHNIDGDPNAPLQRYRNGAAWDPANNRLVVFGGEDGAGNVLGDTWAWDAATGWTNLAPVGAPPARRFAALAFDPVTSAMVLFGGVDSSDVALNDTWLLFGGSWVQPMPATSPPARAHHSLVTRPDFSDVFLCAGHDQGAAPNRVHHLDTWRWSGGTNWIPIVPTTTVVPHGVAGNQAVYDALRQRVVLQGGQGISTNAGATGGAYGTQYGGSPSGWCSEFDCITNEWKLFGAASFSTADPVIGRASRYYPAFIPAINKVIKWGGQNPSGVGSSLSAVKEYQATPLATTASSGNGCANRSGTVMAMTADSDPWTCRDFDYSVSGLASGSLSASLVGFVTASLTLAPFVPAAPGCMVLVDGIATQPLVASGGTASAALPIPDLPSLAGLPLYLQAIQIESAGGAWVSASNRIDLTFGAN